MGKGQSTLQKKMKDIGHDPDHCEGLILELFNEFDRDNSGELEGDEVIDLKKEVKLYLKAAFEQNKRGDYSDEDLDAWITTWLDPNGDKICTKEEVTNGLKFLLKYVE